MKTTGLKATVALLAVMLMAGQAVAGWGGGRGGGWYGPGRGRGGPSDTDEPGPWFQRGPGRGGPDVAVRRGGPRGELRGPDAIPPGWRGQGLGRGWAGGRGRSARMGRGGRAWRQGAGRGYWGGAICPYCQRTARRPIATQRRPMRDNWTQGLRGGRAGEGFRRGDALQGRGRWNRPGQGFGGGNVGPRGWDYERRPMIRRRPLQDNRQGLQPGRDGRGFWRGDEAAPDEPGRGFGRPYRDDRPLPERRWGRDGEARPRLRRGPIGPAEPAERPEEKAPNNDAPAETHKESPVKDPPASNES